MNRNRPSSLTPSSLTFRFSIFGKAFAGLGRAMRFASLAIICTASSTPAQAQSVTFAGSQTNLEAAGGLAVDGSGNLYFTNDINGPVVEEILAVDGNIPANPTILTLGRGLFSGPAVLAVDLRGNVYVGDSTGFLGHNAVKELLAVNGSIPSDPTVRTLASGLSYLAGLAVDDSGNVFFTDATTVKEILAVNGSIPTDPTIISLATFPTAYALAVDSSGNVFVADFADSAVKEIQAVNGSIPADPTIISLGSGFNGVWGVSVDSNGNVYVSDEGHGAVKEILAVNGSIPANPTIKTIFITYLDGNPTILTVDAKGHIFVETPGRLIEVQPQLKSMNFGSANVCTGRLIGQCNQSFSLNYDVDANTTIGGVKIVTTGATNLDFQATGAHGVDGNKTLCSAQTYSSATTCTVDVTFEPIALGQRIGAVEFIDGSGNLLASTPISGTGVGPAIAFNSAAQAVLGGGFDNPIGVTVDASGDIFIADSGNNAVKEILAANGSINTLSSGFNFPASVAVDGAGNVYVADSGNNAVKEILAVNGSIPATPTINPIGSGFSIPRGIAVDGSGNVYVADSGNNAVKEILAVNGSIPATPTINPIGSGFSIPRGIAVDGSGNVYVADSSNNAVKEILAVNGSIPATPSIDSLGSGFNDPTSVVLDAAGDVFVTDSGNNMLKEILAVNASIPETPTIVTLGTAFKHPSGATVDASGDVFVADTGNDRLVELPRSAPPTLTFATTNIGTTSSDSPQSIQFQNIGNQPLLDKEHGAVFGDLIDFPLVGGPGIVPDCTLSILPLAPGAECNLSFDFTPQSANTRHGTLGLTDNALNNLHVTQTVQLSGFGHHAHQTITFPAIGAEYAGTQVTLIATANSGLPVTFASNTPTICTVSSYTATLLAAGYCDIQATQAGNNEYFPGITGQKFLVHHANQSITFSTIAPQVALTTVALDATASSNLPVTFVSNTPTVCTVSGDTATLLTAGSCDVIATQSGDAEYFATVTGQTFLVHHTHQIITFDPIAPHAVNTMLTLTATTNSGLPITFVSTTSTVCTVSGSNASLLNAGTCTIQASQAGDGTYFPSGPKTVSFTVE